jgi:hypothetical protein
MDSRSLIKIEARNLQKTSCLFSTYFLNNKTNSNLWFGVMKLGEIFNYRSIKNTYYVLNIFLSDKSVFQDFKSILK